MNVSLRNSIISENGSYGVYVSGAPTVTLNNNDVWGHTTANYSSVTAGPGSISANPRPRRTADWASPTSGLKCWKCAAIAGRERPTYHREIAPIRQILSAAAACILWGCLDPPTYVGRACDEINPCPTGYLCVSGACAVRGASDAGRSDGSIDAAASDAADRDAGFSDAAASDSTIDGGSPIDSGPAIDAGTGRRVTGSRIRTHVTERGTVRREEDLTNTDIHALVRDGTNFRTYPSVTRADGTFSIDDVPAGEYYFVIGGYSIVTTEDVIDLDDPILGRPDYVEAQTIPTNVTLDLTGLEPWAGSDELQMFCANNGGGAGFIAGIAVTRPADGVTSARVTFDYTEDGIRLVDAARGDRVVVSHLRYHPGTHGYWSVTRGVTVGGVTIRDGVAATIAADLMPLQMQTINLDWRMDEFAALRGDIYPGAVHVDHGFFVDAVPGGLGLGIPGNAPYLLAFTKPAGTANLTAPVSFGNPHDGSDEVVVSYTGFEVSHQVGAARPLVRIVNHYQAQPLSSLPGGAPFRPLFGPPRDVRINGSSAVAPLNGVGMTPLVSWAPPATGVPDYYSVGIYRLNVVNGNTTDVWERELRTRGTSIVIPAGYLVPGINYYLIVSSRLNGGVNVSQQPFFERVPRGFAPAFTAIFVP